VKHRRYALVLERDRHLKWRALDRVEHLLMILCGVTLTGFSTTVFLDVLTRSLGHPWLWLQEVTMTFFIYGIFASTASLPERRRPRGATTTCICQRSPRR
jgi:hypothetical protein